MSNNLPDDYFTEEYQQSMNKLVSGAENILRDLDMPRGQRNERTALCLLALLNLKPGQTWQDATAPMIGVTPIMDFVAQHFQKAYAPNTRETFRRQSLHQLVAAGVVAQNPDDPNRQTNSPRNCYQVVPEFLALVKTRKTDKWESALADFHAGRLSLAQRYASAREMAMVPIAMPDGSELKLSPGPHSQLIKQIVDEFGSRFAPGARLIYAGDTGEKMGFFDEDALTALGVTIDRHSKMPDVVLYDTERNWLFLCEAVTSHGPVDGKRYLELSELFKQSTAGLVFVSAFPDRATMRPYLSDLAWETEAWVADAPTHLMHFNGERFLGPYQTTS